jgi:hypothetical protein
MTFLPINYGYKALHESVHASGDGQSVEVTIGYIGPWDQREAFLIGAIGTRVVTGDIKAKWSLTTTLPYKCPIFSTLPLYAMSFSLKPVGKNLGDVTKSDDQIIYEKAEIELTFKTPVYDFDKGGTDPGNITSDTYSVQSLEVAGEFLTLPTGTFKFPSGKPIDSDAGKFISIIGWNVTRKNIPFLPLDIIASCTGKVNNDLFMGFPAETLLFLGTEPTQERDMLGNSQWSLEYKFSFKPVYGWNKILNPSSGAWEIPTKTGGGRLYESCNFTVLP